MEKLLETERNEFLIACLRTVSAWLNVQVYATSEMGIAIESTVLKTIKKCLKTNADDVLKTSAPAILNYAEIMPCRSVIMESGIIQCLGEILVTPDGKISEEALCLVTQCLMVLCLESPDKGPFTMMLQSLMQLFISLPKSTSLPFYIAALALMIWNLEGAKNYVEQERFFKTLVAFLHNIHKVGETGIQITESYREIWPSVEQLWPIIVKELIRSANNEPWVKEVLLESGIKRKIQNLTSQDSEEPESDLHSGYGLLLTLFED
uniref:Neurochondrin n=1 Tax=Ciona savignyi TaxID=51511 RepID=H2ZC16_CIOSA